MVQNSYFILTTYTLYQHNCYYCRFQVFSAYGLHFIRMCHDRDMGKICHFMQTSRSHVSSSFDKPRQSINQSINQSRVFRDVFRATVLAKLTYCALVWLGLCPANDLARLEYFSRFYVPTCTGSMQQTESGTSLV